MPLLSATNPTNSGLVSGPKLLGERQATNGVSLGTVTIPTGVGPKSKYTVAQ